MGKTRRQWQATVSEDGENKAHKAKRLTIVKRQLSEAEEQDRLIERRYGIIVR